MSSSRPPVRRTGRPSGVQVHADLVRTYRERAGLSREELCDLIGATTRTLRRAETDGIISLPLLKLVCQFLRMPVVAVLRRDAESIRASLRAFGFAPGLPPALVGREPELAELRARLMRPAEPIVLVLEGPIGVGKTSLAQRLAEDTADHFENGVVWVRGDISDVRLVQLDVARALGFDAQLPLSAQGAGGSDWAQAFAAHFWQPHRLLVLDDVTDAQHVRAFVADDRRATILATTRFAHVADEVATDRASIRPLPEAAIMELLSTGLEKDKLAGDRRALARVLELIGGMPGLAIVVRSALRRDRLATPATWVARFDLATTDGNGGGLAQSVLEYYGGLRQQLSPPAWDLFAALGVFGSEPVPLAWVAAAAAAPPIAANAALSELLDAQIVNLYHVPTRDEPEPWVRLATHPALAARSLLADRLDDARIRVLAHLFSEIARARAVSIPEMVRYYRRHQALVVSLRSGLAEGLGPPPDLLGVDSPEAVAPAPIEPARARSLLDLIGAISPLLFDGTIADSAEWLGLGLVAARSLDDVERRGRHYVFCTFWRAIAMNLASQRSFEDATHDTLQRAGSVVPLVAADNIIGTLRLMSAPPDEAARILAGVMRELDRPAAPCLRRSVVMNATTRLVIMGSQAPSPTREAAALARRALDELDLAPDHNAHVAAMIRVNLETYLRRSGDDNQPALAAAVEALRAIQPEPWINAALSAHVACLLGPRGVSSRDEAFEAARRELWQCTRECPAGWAPRLLWFVGSAALYELVRRASAGAAPLVRSGLAAHGSASNRGFPAIPEMCGADVMIQLSTEATGALLDRPYVELALELGEHVTDGWLSVSSLRALLDILPPGA